MGFWDFLYSVRDRVKGITPDLSTVKRAGDAAYDHTSAAVTKIDQVVNDNVIQKLPEYLPDPETRAKIGVFTTTLAKNTGKYVVYEGFKHIPGLTVAHKLISDTVREVQRENHKDGLKEVQETKVERLEKDLRNPKSRL